MLSASVFWILKVVPDIFSVSSIFSSFEMMFANTRLSRWVSPRITAIFLSCSAASMVTKLAPGNKSLATASSFLASLMGTDMMFWPLIVLMPGPNMGCMQMGLIFDGIFESEETTFDFSEDISIRYVPRFISFAISLMISGVLLVGVHSMT